MRNFTFIFLVFMLVCGSVNAQQTPIYSQYILNEFMLNPAMAGITGMTSINISGRKQWTGWAHAPETYSVSGSGRVLKTLAPYIMKRKGVGDNKIRDRHQGKVGLGAAVINDKNGAISKTSIKLTYAYHIPLHMAQFSMGATLITNQFRIDQELAKLGNPGDPYSGLIGASTYSPDAVFGIDYARRFAHIGISVHNLFQTPVKFGETSVGYQQLNQVRHYYLLGSYLGYFKKHSEWEYEPSITSRMTEKLQFSSEFSVRFIYKRELWCGLSYRTSHDLILIMGLKFKRLVFGYSFDYGFNEISRLTYGSHEVVMALKIGAHDKRFRFWERY